MIGNWLIVAASQIEKNPADTNLMNTGYLKECIAVSKQIGKHENGDSK